MAVCVVDGRSEMFLGRRMRARRILQQDQFAFDAQQLGDVSPFVAGFAAQEGLIDGFEPQRDLTRLAETRRRFAEQEEKPRKKSCLTGLFEPTTQRP